MCPRSLGMRCHSRPSEVETLGRLCPGATATLLRPSSALSLLPDCLQHPSSEAVEAQRLQAGSRLDGRVAAARRLEEPLGAWVLGASPVARALVVRPVQLTEPGWRSRAPSQLGRSVQLALALLLTRHSVCASADSSPSPHTLLVPPGSPRGQLGTHEPARPDRLSPLPSARHPRREGPA